MDTMLEALRKKTGRLQGRRIGRVRADGIKVWWERAGVSFLEYKTEVRIACAFLKVRADS